MERKRVLFFGVTGIDKVDKSGGGRGVLNRLGAWARRDRSRTPEPEVIDFEGNYLFNPQRGGKAWNSFLDDEQAEQRRIWRTTWAEFLRDVFQQRGADLYLGMHGCIVRGHYGVRSVLDVRDVAEWVNPDNRDDRARPNLIVTLLDDVYDMWWRTEARSGGEAFKGRPSIEQLVFARRAELIVADQVAHSVDPPIPHFVLSVTHPCRTLSNRIYSENPTTVYLCFPISAPRDLLVDSDDSSGVDEVTGFLEMAYERQAKNPDLVLVCPLGIDELPLVQVTHDALRRLGPKDDVEKAPRIEFDRDSMRWAMDRVWRPEECLSAGPPPTCDRQGIPLAQLHAASGMICTDVGWRDYRLVEQVGETGCLAVFNPKFRNRGQVSRSVREEIEFAAGICPVYVYQNRDHDPKRVFEKQYPTEGGTMPLGPRTQMVVHKDSVQELLDAVESRVRRRVP